MITSGAVSAQSKRTIEVSREVAAVLTRAVAGKAADEFVFVSPTGQPIHHAGVMGVEL